MEAFYDNEHVQVFEGDCLDVLRTIEDASIDAVVTDPPYGINFMGKAWDGPGGMLGQMATGDNAAFQAWCMLWAAECLRVLKPGGHLLAFGGSRTWHRLTAGIEDAGFEIRDSIAWLYGSGFPKSLDVSKAIHAHETTGKSSPRDNRRASMGDAYAEYDGYGKGQRTATKAQTTTGQEVPLAEDASDAARAWSGWGTGLKPAFEPIVVARKPLVGTVASNVLEHGTGALNIAASRVEFASEADEQESKGKNRHGDFGSTPGGNAVYNDYSMVERKNYDPVGRWPTNLILDGSQAAAVGGEARFFPTFHYEAKAPQSERPKFWRHACECEYDEPMRARGKCGTCGVPGEQVAHPTVKPLTLMRWLVRLVTPPGGIVLEPFAGSGTTIEAAVLEGFRCIGIERDADYRPLIVKRLSKPLQQSLFGDMFEEGEAS